MRKEAKMKTVETLPLKECAYTLQSEYLPPYYLGTVTFVSLESLSRSFPSLLTTEMIDLKVQGQGHI